MAILKNANFANKGLVTQWGRLQFNEKGEVEVSENAGKKLSTLEGFSVDLDGSMETSSDKEENDQETEDTTAEDSENDSEPEEGETSAEQEEDAQQVDDEEENATEEENAAYTEEELAKKNVPQLKKIAKDLKLDMPSDSKKQQLIDAILGK